LVWAVLKPELPVSSGTDARTLVPGDLVLIQTPDDPTGKPTYPHFFVVMFVPEPVKLGDHIPCLGVTSRMSDEQFDPEQRLRLPWLNRKGGHPSTGLDKPSVAKVTFRHTLTVEAGQDFPLEVAAQHRGKFIPFRDFQSLTAIANAYNRKLMLSRGPQPRRGHSSTDE